MRNRESVKKKNETKQKTKQKKNKRPHVVLCTRILSDAISFSHAWLSARQWRAQTTRNKMLAPFFELAIFLHLHKPLGLKAGSCSAFSLCASFCSTSLMASCASFQRMQAGRHWPAISTSLSSIQPAALMLTARGWCY